MRPMLRLIKQRFDESGQFLVAQVAWVIALNDTIAIDDDECRRRTHAEVERIVVTDWDTHKRRERELVA